MPDEVVSRGVRHYAPRLKRWYQISCMKSSPPPTAEPPLLQKGEALLTHDKLNSFFAGEAFHKLAIPSPPRCNVALYGLFSHFVRKRVLFCLLLDSKMQAFSGTLLYRSLPFCKKGRPCILSIFDLEVIQNDFEFVLCGEAGVA